MTNYQELKRLAEAACEDYPEPEDQEAIDKVFIAEATPEVVLGLIAEIDRLKAQNRALREVVKGLLSRLEAHDYEPQQSAVRAALAQAEEDTFGLSMSMFANQRDYQDEKNKRLRARINLKEGV